jgi:hypothetical protein
VVLAEAIADNAFQGVVVAASGILRPGATGWSWR